MTSSESEFPKYQIIVEGEEQWLSAGEAARTLNSGMIRTEMGGKALDATFVARPMTREEHNAIIDIMDEWDAAK